MGKPLQSVNFMLRGATVAVALWLSAGGVYAQSAAPLARLAGQWSGSGTIDLSDGSREPIRCRAAYDVLDRHRKVEMSIRCASESYSFDLRGSADDSGGAISGIWSESTRNIAGTISGRAHGDQFRVLATSPAFSATLTLITHGSRQSVSIRAQDPQASLRGASIALRRH